MNPPRAFPAAVAVTLGILIFAGLLLVAGRPRAARLQFYRARHIRWLVAGWKFSLTHPRHGCKHRLPPGPATIP